MGECGEKAVRCTNPGSSLMSKAAAELRNKALAINVPWGMRQNDGRQYQVSAIAFAACLTAASINCFRLNYLNCLNGIRDTLTS